MIFSGYVPTIMGKAQVTVESVELVKSTEGPCVFTCTVKNTGDKPAKAVSVKLANEQPADFPSVSEASPLEPGRSAAVMLTSGSGLMSDYVGGLTYPLTVHAAFLDNSTYTTALTVTCMGGGKPWTPPQPGGGPYLYFAYMGSAKIVKVSIEPLETVASRDYGAEYNGINVFQMNSGLYAFMRSGLRDGKIVKLNSETLEVEASIPITLPQDNDWVYDVASSGDYLYAVLSNLTVIRIQKSTFTIDRTADFYCYELAGSTYKALSTTSIQVGVDGQHLYIAVDSVTSSPVGGILKLNIPDLTVNATRCFQVTGPSIIPWGAYVVGDYLYITDYRYIYKFDKDLEYASQNVDTWMWEGMILYAHNDILCAVTSGWYDAGGGQYKGYANVQRVNLTDWTDTYLYEEVDNPDLSKWFTYPLQADGAYIYFLRYKGDGLYVVKVNVDSTPPEIVAEIGPLS
jgi:hypothetical protein